MTYELMVSSAMWLVLLWPVFALVALVARKKNLRYQRLCVAAFWLETALLLIWVFVPLWVQNIVAQAAIWHD